MAWPSNVNDGELSLLNRKNPPTPRPATSPTTRAMINGTRLRRCGGGPANQPRWVHCRGGGCPHCCGGGAGGVGAGGGGAGGAIGGGSAGRRSPVQRCPSKYCCRVASSGS